MCLCHHIKVTLHTSWLSLLLMLLLCVFILMFWPEFISFWKSDGCLLHCCQVIVVTQRTSAGVACCAVDRWWWHKPSSIVTLLDVNACLHFIHTETILNMHSCDFLLHSYSASDSNYSSTFLHSTWSLCLSVVCHIRALCLNSSTDLHAIWQAHLCGQRHYVRWGLWPQGKGRFGGRTPAKTCNCKLQPNRQCFAATWRMQTTGLATSIPFFAELLWPSLFV